MRDAMRTVQTIRERQQKMASPEFGDRDVFGVKVGPSGAIVQVFQVRLGTGRGADRVRRRGGYRHRPGAERHRARRSSSSTPSRRPRRDVHVPALPEEAEAIEELAERAGRTQGPRRAFRSAATSGVWSTWCSATPSSPIAPRFDAGGTAQYEALELIQAALRLPELPRRIECFDISTIQGAETVASMVVCEDGRMKKGEYRKFRVGSREPGAGSRHSGRRDAGVGEWRSESWPPWDAGATACPERAADPGFSTTSPRWSRWSGAATRGCSKRAGRFRTCIVIDGGKGQLNAAYAALESIGPVEPGRGRTGQEGGARLHPRSRPAAGAGSARAGAAAAAADSRRGPPLRRDLPSQGARDARLAVGAGCGPRRRPAPAARRC